jgi:hypothetical protein
VVFDFRVLNGCFGSKLPPAVEIERALSAFGPGGGTDIRPGVEQAAQALARSDMIKRSDSADRRHCR